MKIILKIMINIKKKLMIMKILRMMINNTKNN